MTITLDSLLHRHGTTACNRRIADKNNENGMYIIGDHVQVGSHPDSPDLIGVAGKIVKARDPSAIHVANCQGLYLGLYAQRHTWPSNRSTMMSTLHEWWPEFPETVLDPPDAMFEEGCIWGLVGIGGTYSKSCCQAPCACACPHLECVWSPVRKDICVDSKWRYKHVTQLVHTIRLEFPVSARPCGGSLFTQRIPLRAIPIDSMSSEQIHMWNATVARRNPPL